MKIYDPLYGRFELLPISSELCVLPEVRRLSQIRLLNSISPSLATLSELRRYAHTMGVLHLFGRWKTGAGRKYSREEQDALEVAIILHDIATPPFGHLFEYILKDATGWDHEAEAVTTLLKSYSPASTAQPIYAGKTPKVLDRIERHGVNLELVRAILTKKHKLSGLIMGVMDFDNIDNVWRMAWALGIPLRQEQGAVLAEALDVDDNGVLVVHRSAEEILQVWSELRRAVYNVLVFDQPTVASQAILTYCIRTGIETGAISGSDWFLTDESLLSKLSVDPKIRVLIEQQYLGVLPAPLLTIQVPWKELPLYGMARRDIEAEILARLRRVGVVQGWVYVFKERGSFEKRVRYSVEGGKIISFGNVSQSLIISVFSGKALLASQRKAAVKVIVDFLKDNEVDANNFTRILEAGDESLTHDSGLPL